MSIVIVGAGPNLGLAIARRFGRHGFAVWLVSRTQAKLDDLASQLESEGVPTEGHPTIRTRLDLAYSGWDSAFGVRSLSTLIPFQ